MGVLVLFYFALMIFGFLLVKYVGRMRLKAQLNLKELGMILSDGLVGAPPRVRLRMLV